MVLPFDIKRDDTNSKEQEKSSQKQQDIDTLLFMKDASSIGEIELNFAIDCENAAQFGYQFL